jgi:hypothetical protein
MIHILFYKVFIVFYTIKILYTLCIYHLFDILLSLRHTYWSMERMYIFMYKVVKIWPEQTVTCLHTNSPSHIWTTLYIKEQNLKKLITRGMKAQHAQSSYHEIYSNYNTG